MQFETRQRVNKRQNKVVLGGGAAEEKMLTSTDSCEGRKETSVIQDGPKENVRD